MAPSSSASGAFTSYADWQDWENAKQRNRRKSLLQVAGIVGFIILLLVGIFFVKLPSSQETSSKMHSLTMSTRDVGPEQPQMHSQASLEKDTVKPRKVLSDNNHRDSNDTAAKNTPKNTLVEDKKPAKQEDSQYIIVKEGDTFKKILLKAYGQYNQSRISLVLDANPEISNVNTIFVGQLIRLPEP
jgi:phage tail protein X